MSFPHNAYHGNNGFHNFCDREWEKNPSGYGNNGDGKMVQFSRN